MGLADAKAGRVVSLEETKERVRKRQTKDYYLVLYKKQCIKK